MPQSTGLSRPVFRTHWSSFGIALAWLVGFTSACSDSGDRVTGPEEVRGDAALQVVEPAATTLVRVGDSIRFRADGRDGLGDTFSSNSFLWSSDLDGPIGSGSEVTVGGLTVGTHSVFVRVDAGVDGVLRDSVDIVVQPPDEVFEPELTEEEVEVGFVFGQLLIQYFDDDPSPDAVVELNREFEFLGQRRVAGGMYLATVGVPEAELETLVFAVDGHERVSRASLNLTSAVESPSPAIELPGKPDPAMSLPDFAWHFALDELMATLQAEGHSAFGAGQRVGIIDTGVDMDHPAFAHVEWVSPRFAPSAQVSDDEAARIGDSHGHGTQVISMISASLGTLQGVAPGAAIVPIKNCRETLFRGCVATLENTVRGLEWAREVGVDIVNLSVGNEPTDQALEAVEILDRPFARLAESGILVVVAAGNVPEGETWAGVNSYAQVAARHGHVVVGASVEGTSQVWSGSAEGPEVDVLAPGQVAGPGIIEAAVPGGGSEPFGATSGATPIVAGLAALHLQRGVSSGQLRQTLRDWTVEFGALGETNAVGRVIGGVVISGVTLDDRPLSSLPATEEVTLRIFGRNLTPPTQLYANGEPLSSVTDVSVTDIEFHYTVPASGSVVFEARHPAGPQSDLTLDVSEAPGSGFRTIEASVWKSFAIDLDGQVWAWGKGSEGRLGDGGSEDRPSPVRLSTPSGTGFSDVSARGYHWCIGTDCRSEHVALALDDSGTAWAWGTGQLGQLGHGGTNDRNVPHRVEQPAGVTFVAISTSGVHSLALDQQGRAWAWGWGETGALGTGDGEARLVPVAVEMPPGVSFTSVHAGLYSSLALDTGGRAWAWGSAVHGRLGNGQTSGIQTRPVPVTMPSGVVFTQLSNNSDYPVALDQQGQVWRWGREWHGVPHQSQETIHAEPVLVQMPSSVRFTSIASSGHSLALDADGNAWAWGRNSGGQLGDGSMEFQRQPVPVRMPAGIGFSEVSAGSHSLAVDRYGNAWAWGAGDFGGLGDGTTEDRPEPVRVISPGSETILPALASSGREPVDQEFTQDAIHGLRFGPFPEASRLRPERHPLRH